MHAQREDRMEMSEELGGGGGGGAKCLGACRRMDLPGRGMHTEIVKRSERRVGDQSEKKLRRVDFL